MPRIIQLLLISTCTIQKYKQTKKMQVDLDLTCTTLLIQQPFLKLGKIYMNTFLFVYTLWVCFCRCQSLQIHFDLYQCHHASCTDIGEQRAQRRLWQHSLNHDIQRITLELIVNIFRFCVCLCTEI